MGGGLCAERAGRAVGAVRGRKESGRRAAKSRVEIVDWRAHVVYAVERGVRTILRLWGGPLREAGCTEPTEMILPLRKKEVDTARCFATMGRVRLHSLAVALGADERTSVVESVERSVFYRVYEVCWWEVDEWLSDVQHEVKIEWANGVPVITYPTPDHWLNLSWIAGFSPFDFPFKFIREGEHLMTWTGIGEDWQNLQVEFPAPDVPIDAMVSKWAAANGVYLYRCEDWASASPKMPWEGWTDKPHEGLERCL